MTCEELVQGEELERYVAGQLEEEAQAAVERHVFECDACAARLDDLMSVRVVLAEPAGDQSLGLPPRRVPTRWYGQPLAVAAGIATLLFSAAGAIWWTREAPAVPPAAASAPPVTPPPAVAAAPAAAEPAPVPVPAGIPAPQPIREPAPPDAGVLAQLAQFEAPALLALTVRGDARPAEAPGLAAAREAYAAGRYGEATRQLDQWETEHGLSPDLAFYRGICRLKTGAIRPGLADLAIAAQSTEVPYAVEAHYYVARGRLALGDLEGARDALAHYVELEGDFTRDARLLLDRLPPSSRRAR